MHWTPEIAKEWGMLLVLRAAHFQLQSQQARRERSYPHAQSVTAHTKDIPQTMFTAFRCFTGECVNENGFPITVMLKDVFGLPFVLGYIASYMLVSLGIFNVILAVYVDITMKAAKENDAITAEQYSRESVRIARATRELLKLGCC